MPLLSSFFGIDIKMYFLGSEHNPPHIHAVYAEESAAIDVRTGEIIEGSLPDKVLRLVKEWIRLYEDDLLRMWESQEFSKLPPLR